MKNGRLIARIVFLLYLAAVLYLCFGNFSDMSSVAKHFLGIESDKVVHFLMFLPFPVLFYMAFGWRTRNPWHSILLAVATSIDALAVGFSFAMIQEEHVARAFLVIGLTSFVVSFLAYTFVKRLSNPKISRYAEIVGGIVLILIGLKILFV